MRVLLRYLGGLAGVLAAACTETEILVPGGLAPPQNLAYRLEPSGDPDLPSGILLSWDPISDPSLSTYRVYSRGGTTGSFGLRGETSSNTFHDNGVPHLEYFVTAVDVNGTESDGSEAVTVDERLQLARPASLTSVSLNGAIHLGWDDNAFEQSPARFLWYRIYSTGYDLDQGLCDTGWVLEGTTVAPEFLAGALTNGVPRCYGVSAISTEGYESLWSPLRQDTPRPDARNVLVFAYDEDRLRSGFRFWDDVNGDGRGQGAELGIVADGDRTDIDFWIYRDPADSTLWFVPEFSGTRVRVYGSAPIADLTSIDFAPVSGYARNMIQATPGFGYVFEIVEGNTVRYGALRVTHAGRDYVIFDWSFQTDPGNPELIRGLQTAADR
ncbi:MAG: hypothetical protein ACREL9_04540 [Gemmatimonadales bacterium]